MELEDIKQKMAEFKNMVDTLLEGDMISSTDYALFCSLSLRLDRKIEKRKMQQNLIQKKIVKKVEQ